jgi:RNA polymerase sigma-70 factor (ECF subfamily)
MSEQPVTLTPERVFREHAPRVYNLARRLLGNDTDAEDVTQDVMVQVVRHLGEFRGDAALTTWLHRVTVNAALTLRRRRAARPETLVDPSEQFLEDGHHARPINEWSELPEAKTLAEEQTQVVEAAIAKLPELYRDVYVLADIEQLSNPEIAEILGMSVPAVKSRLHRARTMMRDALDAYFRA